MWFRADADQAAAMPMRTHLFISAVQKVQLVLKKGKRHRVF
ncbi:MAG: hypothetical protein OJF61_002038 [Rhodanobacteraceae bacterium]|nr:MAG: hypothetical protein OJF61_002038 [Rhodanobacteraceae bacterium]